MLGSLGLISPFVLSGAEIMYAHAYLKNDRAKMSWALLPGILGSAGWIVVAGRLFTFMQMRRGWAPLLQHPKTIEPITDVAIAAALIFGATAGEKGFGHMARQASVVVPGMVAILGMALGKALLTYTSLQNRLGDESVQAWAGGPEWP